MSIKKAKLTLLFRENIELEYIQKTLLKIDNYSVIFRIENLGVKRLAYKIEGEIKALYIDLVLGINKKDMTKVCDLLSLSDDVLRYLLVSDTDIKKRQVIKDLEL